MIKFGMIVMYLGIILMSFSFIGILSVQIKYNNYKNRIVLFGFYILFIISILFSLTGGFISSKIGSYIIKILIS